MYDEHDAAAYAETAVAVPSTTGNGGGDRGRAGRVWRLWAVLE